MLVLNVISSKLLQSLYPRLGRHDVCGEAANVGRQVACALVAHTKGDESTLREVLKSVGVQLRSGEVVQKHLCAVFGGETTVQIQGVFFSSSLKVNEVQVRQALVVDARKWHWHACVTWLPIRHLNRSPLSSPFSQQV